MVNVHILTQCEQCSGQAAPTSTLRIAYIDVGQGDAALIRNSGGFVILIDGGKTSAGPVVVAYLRAQRG